MDAHRPHSLQAAHIPCDAANINEMIKLMDANKCGGECDADKLQIAHRMAHVVEVMMNGAELH